MSLKVNFEGRDVEVIEAREYKGDLYFRVLWKGIPTDWIPASDCEPEGAI